MKLDATAAAYGGIIEKLTKVIVTLEAHLSSVVRSLDFDKAWNDFFAELDKADAAA